MNTVATSNGNNVQVQTRLEFLDRARRALLGISPNAAGFFGREFNDLAIQQGIQLSENTQRTQCSYCGSVLVGGKTLYFSRIVPTPYQKPRTRRYIQKKLNKQQSSATQRISNDQGRNDIN